MPRLLAGDPPRAGLLVEALRAGPHQAGGRARAGARGGRRGGGRDGEERRRGRCGRLGGRLQSAVRLAAYRDAAGHGVLQLVELLVDPRELVVAGRRRLPLRPRDQPRRVARAAAQRRRGGRARRRRPACAWLGLGLGLVLGLRLGAGSGSVLGEPGAPAAAPSGWWLEGRGWSLGRPGQGWGWGWG